MTVSYGVQRNFFTSTIFVGRSAGSCVDFQNKIFNISMLHFNFYPLGSGRPGLLKRAAKISLENRDKLKTAQFHLVQQNYSYAA